MPLQWAQAAGAGSPDVMRRRARPVIYRYGMDLRHPSLVTRAGSLQLRQTVGRAVCAFEGVGGLQQLPFLEEVTDQLEPDG